MDQFKSAKVYFISGHLDGLSDEIFSLHYKPSIDLGIGEEKSQFVMGDSVGADTMAQHYLDEMAKSVPGLRDRVTVFHMFDKPRNNVGNFATHGGFKDDESRDRAMTMWSTDDILWIRSAEESKKLYGKKFRANRISGTEKNKLRREEMKKSSIIKN